RLPDSDNQLSRDSLQRLVTKFHHRGVALAHSVVEGQFAVGQMELLVPVLSIAQLLRHRNQLCDDLRRSKSLLDDDIGQRLFDLYARLGNIRAEHPALRTGGFYPWPYRPDQGHLDEHGHGVDVDRRLVIYQQWGPPRR